MKIYFLTKLNGHIVGVGAGVLSAACFGLIGVLVNGLADTISATEITLVRGLIGVLVISLFVRHRLHTLIQKNAVSVWVRAVAGAISILCFSWNLQHTDVGTANILFNLSLIFVLFADYLTGQIRSSLRTVACVILVVGGIGIYWFGNKIFPSPEVMMVGLIGAVAATIAYAALSRASRKNDSWLIVWAVSLMSIPVSLIAKTGGWSVPSTKSTLILIVIVMCSIIAHYLLNVSFAKLSLPIASALGPSSVVWSVLMLALYQGIVPTPNAILGVTVYAVGMWLLIGDSKKRDFA